MEHPADFRLETTEAGKTAVLTGDWTAVDMGWANERLGEALKGADGVNIDLSGVGRCDTSGVWGVIRAAEQSARPGKIIAPPATERLFELVRQAIGQEPTPTYKKRSFYMLFDRIGRGVVDLGINIYDTLIFNGHLLFAVARACAHPRRIRWAPVFSLMERAGLDAMPIVATTTFFIGAVVGLLGANMLSQFGAQVFAVELIGIAVLREFNILITAVLLAGRSASSFAAEIGSMKMNQEIDAMQVMGVDPFDALVFPRFLALLLTIPLLTFVATIAGLVGGLMVAVTILGLSPEAFFSAPGRQRRGQTVLDRHVQGAGDGHGDRRHRLSPGPGGGRRCGIPGPAGHRRRGSRHLRDHPDRRDLRPDLHEAQHMTAEHHFHSRPAPEPEAELDQNAPPIEVKDLLSQFGDHVIHKDLNLTIPRGEVVGIVGGSGTGKSVLLNTIIGLKAPEGGSVKIFGQDIKYAKRREWTAIERRWGVLFQQGALWSNLTVKENVAAPMYEHTDMLKEEIDRSRRSEDRPGGAAGRRRGAEALGTVGRDDQARGSGARSGPGSGAAVPGRADFWARSDQRGGVRRIDQRPLRQPAPDGVHDHPRSGQPLRDHRPRWP